jgi:hypothetical protein
MDTVTLSSLRQKKINFNPNFTLTQNSTQNEPWGLHKNSIILSGKNMRNFSVLEEQLALTSSVKILIEIFCTLDLIKIKTVL